MASEVQPWTPTVEIPSTVVHAVAILATIFRLLYRWHLSRFWWEDGWAALALLCDMVCLASIWMQVAPNSPNSFIMNIAGNWVLSISITSIVWFARMSILCSIVRIANPTPMLRHVAYGIGTMFLAMEAGLIAQKIDICVVNFCWFMDSVAIVQIIMCAISDTILVALPIWFLWGINMSLSRRVLILSTFCASILITGMTVLHSILILEEPTNITLIIDHIKAALALLVCNLLVLVTLVYRLCRKSDIDIEDAVAGVCRDSVELTSVTVIPTKLSSQNYSVLDLVDEMGAPPRLDACTER